MIAGLQVLLFLVFYVAIFVMSAWAAIDLLRRPATAFTQGGKLTKNKWGGILGTRRSPGAASGSLHNRQAAHPAGALAAPSPAALSPMVQTAPCRSE